MRRALVAALILAAAGAIALRAGAADILRPDTGKPGPADAERFIEVRVQDRGNSRMVWVANSASQGTAMGNQVTLAAGQDIDVTAASLYVETNTVASFIGYVNVITATPNSNFLYPLQFAFGGHTSQHFTFDPPLQLRAQDRIAFSSGNAPTFSRVEISLHGYIPGAARENGIMAR
jgi:hypothetical protein